MFGKTCRAKGFTLVETIMVFLVLGVLSGVIISRTGNGQIPETSGQVMINSGAMTTVSNADQANIFAKDIARIQALALNNGVPLRMSITFDTVTYCDPSTSPTVCTPVRRNFKYDVKCLAFVSGTACTSGGLAFVDPLSGQNFLQSIDPLLTLTATDGSGAEALTLDFDSIGRPSLSTALIGTNPARVFTFIADITQSAAAGISSVTLRPITGFAEVSN